MNIPVAHTQGGEITGSIDESVRHAVTKLSHVHFPATAQAAEVLIRMGEDPQTVHLVGCPSIDMIADLDLALDGDLFSRYGGVGGAIDPHQPYLVVLQHPVTTEFGRGLVQIQHTLEGVAALDMQTVWLWPNVDAGSDEIAKGLRHFRETRDASKLHFYRNFAVEDYARLINSAGCLIGNSSSALREGAYLGVPAVNIGSRQAGRERGPNVLDVDYDTEQIVDAVRAQIAHGRYESSDMFGKGDAGRRIADVLANVTPSVQKRLTYS
jgi:UDP-hydrolysing UDP-N-acetyl-D-glucosamine 2-epimerase